MTDPVATSPETAVLPGRPMAQRASDLERQAVVDHLRAATTEGRLTLDEFAERVQLVLESRTHAELTPLTADLPVPAGSAPGHVVPAPVGGPSVGVHRRRLVNVFGGARHAGAWEAGREMTVVAVCGHSLVDLTACRLEPGVDAVDVRTIGVCAGIELVVPPGAVVDAGGFVLFGGRQLRHDPPTTQPMPGFRVRVRSYGMFGGLLVRSSRRVP